MKSILLIAIILSTTFFNFAAAGGPTFTWINAACTSSSSPCDWSEGTNWSNNGPGGSLAPTVDGTIIIDMDAFINVPGATYSFYTMTLGSQGNTRNIRLKFNPTGTITMSGASTVYAGGSIILNSVVGQFGNVDIKPSATLELEGTANFELSSGATLTNGGKIYISSSTSMITTSGSLSVGSSGTFYVNGSLTVGDTISIQNSGQFNTGGSVATIDGNIELNGAGNFGAASTIITGFLQVRPTNGNGNCKILSGASVSSTGVGSVNGSLILDGAWTHTGEIYGTATVSITGSWTVSGKLKTSGNLVLKEFSDVTLSGTNNELSGTFDSQFGSKIKFSGSTFITGPLNNVYGTVIVGANVNVTTSGSGWYQSAGLLNMQGGALTVKGTGAKTIFIQTNANLTGHGSLYTQVDVTGEGKVVPYDGITVGTLEFFNGLDLAWTSYTIIHAFGTDNDKLIVHGTFSAGGYMRFFLHNAPNQPTNYTAIDPDTFSSSYDNTVSDKGGASGTITPQVVFEQFIFKWIPDVTPVPVDTPTPTDPPTNGPTNGPIEPINIPISAECTAAVLSCGLDFAACSFGLLLNPGKLCSECYPEQSKCLAKVAAECLTQEIIDACKTACPAQAARCNSSANIFVNWNVLFIALLLLIATWMF